MQAVLSLVCEHCHQMLMQQKVSCGVGSYTTINIDELTEFAGPCCTKPRRVARVEFQAIEVIVEATK